MQCLQRASCRVRGALSSCQELKKSRLVSCTDSTLVMRPPESIHMLKSVVIGYKVSI